MRERLPGPARRLLRPRAFGLRQRTRPISEHWGYDRGTPIDRWYIERFLAGHRADVHGAVLEVKDDTYARRFGSAVERVDVLDIDPRNARATVIADLASAPRIPDGSYDCFILTQTLQYIRDAAGALGHAHRILAPGGTLLLTVPALGKMTSGTPTLVDHWRFTETSCSALVESAFGGGAHEVSTYGNVVASAGFLLGYAAEELSARERDTVDPRFPVVLAARAVRR